METELPPEYDRLERNAIQALNDVLEAEEPTTDQLRKAKIARDALDLVHSHQRIVDALVAERADTGEPPESRSLN